MSHFRVELAADAVCDLAGKHLAVARLHADAESGLDTASAERAWTAFEDQIRKVFAEDNEVSCEFRYDPRGATTRLVFSDGYNESLAGGVCVPYEQDRIEALTATTDWTRHYADRQVPRIEIPDKALAQVVERLINDPDSVGELCELDLHRRFVADVASVVSDYCGDAAVESVTNDAVRINLDPRDHPYVNSAFWQRVATMGQPQVQQTSASGVITVQNQDGGGDYYSVLRIHDSPDTGWRLHMRDVAGGETDVATYLDSEHEDAYAAAVDAGERWLDGRPAKAAPGPRI